VRTELSVSTSVLGSQVSGLQTEHYTALLLAELPAWLGRFSETVNLSYAVDLEHARAQLLWLS